MDQSGEQRKSNLGGITGKGFMPGRSGNPAGAAKGPRTLTARLKAIIEREAKEGKDLGDLIMETLVKTAAKGDVKAIALLMDRLDGKVPQSLQVSGDPNLSPVRVETFDAALAKIYGGAAPPQAQTQTAPPPPEPVPKSSSRPSAAPSVRPRYRPRRSKP